MPKWIPLQDHNIPFMAFKMSQEMAMIPITEMRFNIWFGRDSKSTTVE